jgi:uncharacterized protein YoxC
MGIGMDDLTLEQRVKLIQEFEREKPGSLKAAGKKAVWLLALAAVVLGVVIVTGLSAVSRLQRERATIQQDIADLNREKEQVLAQKNAAQRSLADTVASIDASRKAVAVAQSTTSADTRARALAAADEDLASAYIVGRSAQIAKDPKQTPRAELIAQLYSRDANERLRAYGALVETSRRDPKVIPELLDFAHRNEGADRANGIYNTLVLLSHLDTDTLNEHADAVRRFARETRSLGPRTSARADKLIARVP